MKIQWNWLDQPEQIETLVAHLRQQDEIALDTESNGFFGYHNTVCLLQFATAERIDLVDVLALSSESSQLLATIFEDPSIRKVMHAADNDLIGIHRSFGVQLQNLFDTFLAARFLALPKHGLGSLLLEVFDVKTSKRFQRLNWSQRPLPHKALDYAAIDVAYLLELKRRFVEALTQQGWLDAVEQESQALTERDTTAERPFDPEGFRRLPNTDKLPKRKLGVLRALYLWRHDYCSQEDKAAFLVMPDHQLVHVARRTPRNLEQLARLTEWDQQRLEEDGAGILQAIHEGLQKGVPPLPPKKHKGPKKRYDQALFDALRGWRSELAERLSLEPGLLAPNQLLKELSHTIPRSEKELARLPGFLPWRIGRFGPSLLSFLQEYNP